MTDSSSGFTQDCQNKGSGEDNGFFTRVQSILGDINTRAPAPVHQYSCLKTFSHNNKKTVNFADSEKNIDGNNRTVNYESLKQRILSSSRVPTPSLKANIAYNNCRSGTPYPLFDKSQASFVDDSDDEDDDDFRSKVTLISDVSCTRDNIDELSSSNSIECIVLNDDGNIHSKQPLSGRTYGAMDNDFIVNSDDDDNVIVRNTDEGFGRTDKVKQTDKIHRNIMKDTFGTDDHGPQLERYLKVDKTVSQAIGDINNEEADSQDVFRITPVGRETMKVLEYESESEDELNFSEVKKDSDVPMAGSSNDEFIVPTGHTAKSEDLSPRYDRLDLSGLVSRASERKDNKKKKLSTRSKQKMAGKKSKDKVEKKQELDEVITRRPFNTVSVLPGIPLVASNSPSPDSKQKVEILRNIIKDTFATDDHGPQLERYLKVDKTVSHAIGDINNEEANSQDVFRITPVGRETMKVLEYESESEDELNFPEVKKDSDVTMNGSLKDEFIVITGHTAKSEDSSPRYDRLDLSGLVSRASERNDNKKKKLSTRSKQKMAGKKSKDKVEKKQELDEVVTRRPFNTVSVLPGIPQVASNSPSSDSKQKVEILRQAFNVINATHDDKPNLVRKDESGGKKRRNKKKEELQPKADFNPNKNVLPNISGSESSSLLTDGNKKGGHFSGPEKDPKCIKTEKDQPVNNPVIEPNERLTRIVATGDVNKTVEEKGEQSYSEPAGEENMGDTYIKNDDIDIKPRDRNVENKKKKKTLIVDLSNSRTLNTEPVLPRIKAGSDCEDAITQIEHNETDKLRRHDIMDGKVNTEKPSGTVVIGSTAVKCAANDSKILEKVIDKINNSNQETFVPMKNENDDSPTIKAMDKTRSLTVAKFRAQFNRKCQLLPKIGETVANECQEKIQPIEEPLLCSDHSKKAKPTKSFINKMEYLRQQNLLQYQEEVKQNFIRAETLYREQQDHKGIQRCLGSHELNSSNGDKQFEDTHRKFAPEPPVGKKPMHQRKGRRYKEICKGDQEVLRRKINEKEFKAPHAPEYKKENENKHEKVNFLMRLFK